MSLLGPDGQPVEPTAPDDDTAPPSREMHPDAWGMGFIAQPDGTFLAMRFSSAEGDLRVQSVPGGPPWLLLRARPTERGHLTAPSFDEWAAFAAAEVDAVSTLRTAQADVVTAAEHVTQSAAEDDG